MNVEDRISAAILRIRHRQPFFGVLALFAEHRLDATVPTAATDGKRIFFNPGFAGGLSESELDAVMVHELLHAALLHCTRRGVRDGLLWNIAADIVVNGIIRLESGLKLPSGACIEPELEHHEVEEVYELIRDRPAGSEKGWIGPDLFPGGPPSGEASGGGGEPGSQAHLSTLESHWKQAWQQASILVEASGKGTVPAGLRRCFDSITTPQLDWRSLLWRFLVRTPVDFAGFDRRLVGRGLYIEALEGESISVRICVDTSGSVDSATLAAFLSEVREIVRMYPHLEAKLFYADAALHGPFELSPDEFEPPRGGGGTSFKPFFEHVRRDLDAIQTTALVYLTDGYGDFPKVAPECPVLWVVPPGGLPNAHFPFGEVARLRESPSATGTTGGRRRKP